MMPGMTPLGPTNGELGHIITLVGELTGISLNPGKRDMIRARLQRRVRALGLGGFGEYIALLESPEGALETREFMDAMTTNTTQFLREPHHFDFLSTHVLGETHGRGGEGLRVWSAGCSSGNEAYSIAMVMVEYYRAFDGFGVIGTDISGRMLGKAVRGVYGADEVEPFVPPALRSRYLMRGKGPQQGFYRIVPELRARVSFEYLNLMGAWPFGEGSLDIVFCRNVMIYFDKATRVELVGRFHDALSPGGYLFIGHSETLTGINGDFRLVRPTIYRKDDRICR